MHPFPDTGGIDLGEASNFNYWTKDRIRWADTDLMGHVNNGSYTNYLETGRVALLWEVVEAVKGGHDWVIARLTLDYMKEVHFRVGRGIDPYIHIGTRVLKVGTKSCVLGQGLFVDGVMHARAVSTCVAVDKSGTVVIGDPVREQLMMRAPEPGTGGFEEAR